jgi:hypothetical protein
MSLFEIFKRAWRTPRIPREVFVEELNVDEENGVKPVNINNMDDQTIKINEMQYKYGSINCRKEVDDFLSRDFDADGYRDALIDSDTSNMKSHMEILKLKLELIISNSLACYENENKHYDVDIKIMSSNGILDLVDKLSAGQACNIDNMARIKDILSEAKAGKGIGYLPILSYEQGFKRGIAAKLFI